MNTFQPFLFYISLIILTGIATNTQSIESRITILEKDIQSLDSIKTTLIAKRASPGLKEGSISRRISRAGNVLFNLDKQYPNGIFSVFIKKEDIPNFPYDILPLLQGKKIAVSGKVSELGGKPVMYISNGKDIEVMN